MRVFLTSANGYIGSAVAERLRAAGHQLTALARSDASAAELESAGIQPVRGDFSDPKGVASAARAADGVINLATTFNPAIDVPAIDAVLDALAGSNKPFVDTSGVWVHGDTGGKVVDETSPLNAAEIVAWRPTVEKRVLDSAKRGIRSVVIRPGLCMAGVGAFQLDSSRPRRRKVLRAISSRRP